MPSSFDVESLKVGAFVNKYFVFCLKYVFKSLDAILLGFSLSVDKSPIRNFVLFMCFASW